MRPFPESPTGVIEVPVPELERRQTDINRITPTHPLLPLALDCIKDKEKQRPNAAQLCQRLAALKEAPAYTESMQGRQEEEAAGEQQAEGRASLEEKERENTELREQLEQNEEHLQETVQQLAESQDTVRAKDRQIVAHQQQLREKHQQLQQNDQQIREKDQQIREKVTRIETVERENFMLKEAERRLREMKDAELQSVRREVVDLQQLLAHFQRLDLQTQDTAPQEVSVWRSLLYTMTVFFDVIMFLLFMMYIVIYHVHPHMSHVNHLLLSVCRLLLDPHILNHILQLHRILLKKR